MNFLKNFLFILLIVFWIHSGFSQNQPFITVWQTDAEVNTGYPNFLTSNDNQVRLAASGDYDYEWVELDEDGNSLNNSGSGTASNTEVITFPHPGIYQISITPAGDNPFHRIESQYMIGDYHKLLEIKHWGDVVWTSFDRAFQGCYHMEMTAEDVPDLSALTNMEFAFNNTVFEGNAQMENWDVSNVETMSRTFSNNPNFNQDLANWDMSNVINIKGMFAGALSFNQDISNWDVSAVQNMSELFAGTGQFNQDISSWDVSNVTDMSFMFSIAQSFNQPIGNWDVSAVENMSGIFDTAAFNQPIGNWDVSNVTNMAAMFTNNSVFDQDISNWDVSNVTNMNAMFHLNTHFNVDISSWNVGSVTNMSMMFADNNAFNQDIGFWDVSNVTDMSQMFDGNQAFNQELGKWNVENVVNMTQMFRNSSYNQDLGGWNPVNVIYMTEMFKNASDFNQYIGDWDVSNVQYMPSMFENAQEFNQDIGNWEVSNVKWFKNIFTGAVSFDQNLGNWNLSSLMRIDEHPHDFSFSDSGMSCESYSETLKGWQENSATPAFRILDATGLEYSPEVIVNRDGLIDNQWIINGDSEGTCELSIEDFSLNEFKIYPNPVEDILNIEGNNSIEKIEIFNLWGQKLSDRNYYTENILLDVSEFSSGMYLMRFYFKGQTKVTRIVKK